MTIGVDSGFEFSAELNDADHRDRDEYEDWFCGEVRSNQILFTKYFVLYFI